MDAERFFLILIPLGIAVAAALWLYQATRLKVHNAIELNRSQTYLFYFEASFNNKREAEQCVAATKSPIAKTKVYETANRWYWNVRWEIKSKPGSLLLWAYRQKLYYFVERYQGGQVIEYAETDAILSH
jgi:hypothetical protein